MTDTTSDTDAGATDTVSVTEAAALLGVSERTVWRRIKQGKIDTQKTVDGVRVRLSDVSHTSVAADGTVAQALEIIQEMHEAQTAELERLRRDNQQLAGQVG